MEKNNLINPDLEFNLISLLLNTEDIGLRIKIISDMEDSWFGDQDARLIFQSIKQIISENKSFDDDMISAYVEKLDSLGRFSSKHEINILIISTKNRNIKDGDIDIGSYISEIEDLYRRRLMLNNISELSEKVKDKNISFDALIRDHQTLSFSARNEYIISPPDIEERRMKGLQERVEMGGKGYFTGYDNLDSRLSTGFYPGKLSVIAGRPGMGKSLLKSNFIHNLAPTGCNIINFCFEQDFQDEFDRLTSIMTGIPAKELIQVWRWEEGDSRILQLKKTAKIVNTKWNIHFVDKRTMTTTDALNIVNLINQRQKVNLVFFDLFDRFSDVNDPLHKAARISQKLPVIVDCAKMLQVHFCLVTQISRKTENRKSPEPQLSDLKDSGAYEEVADLIFFVYREDYYDNDVVDDKFQVIIAKQRNGEVGKAFFDWDRATLKLTERFGF